MNPSIATSLASLAAREYGRCVFKNYTASSSALVSRRWVSSSVRVIALEDLPHGKAYKGDVLQVKPGYARNFLLPKKMAVYATPQNFEKLNIKDPEFESEAERRARQEKDSSMSAKEEQYLKQADILKKYLKNKVVSLYSKHWAFNGIGDAELVCWRILHWFVLL